MQVCPRDGPSQPGLATPAALAFELFPALADVTLLTAPAKLPVVHIVSAVTRDTLTAQGRGGFAFRCLLFVATFAGQFAVLTDQPIAGLLIMVEIPQGPGARVVTALTLNAKFLLVLVLFLVAREAVPRRILEARIQVATLARCGYVAPSQREACRRMVKLRNPPRTIIVTLFTGLAQLSLVLVVLLVAAEAFHRGLSHATQVFMAG